MVVSGIGSPKVAGVMLAYGAGNQKQARAIVARIPQGISQQALGSGGPLVVFGGYIPECIAASRIRVTALDLHRRVMGQADEVLTPNSCEAG
jgi:hypothetical protein